MAFKILYHVYSSFTYSFISLAQSSKQTSFTFEILVLIFLLPVCVKTVSQPLAKSCGF